MKIITVHDKIVEAFGIPFFTRSNGEAIRSFTDEINKEGTALNAHPDHYDLYEIGEYDERTAAIIPTSITKLLMRGSDANNPIE